MLSNAVFRNWFTKFAQYLNVDFNISTLEKLLKIQGEHPGQNYLFQNEEIDQLKHLRGNLPLETKAKIQRLIELSHNLFLEIGQISFESYNIRQDNYIVPYLESPPYNDERVIEQAKEDAHQVIYKEYKWKKEEFAKFMVFLSGRSELDSLLNDFFEKGLTRSPDIHDTIYKEVKDKYQMFEQAGINIKPTFQEFDIAFQNRDPNTYYREFFKVLSKLTEDMIVAVVDNNEINPFASNKNKNITDNPYFPWINKKSLKIITGSHYKDALGDWHFDQNEDYYLEGASEVIAESDSQYALEIAKQLDHKYGDLSEIADRNPLDEDDSRKDISIITLSEYFQELYNNFKGMASESFTESYNIINSILLAIKKISVDPNISNIFANRTTEIDANLENFGNYLSELKAKNDLKVIEQLPPEVLDTDIGDIRRQLDEQAAFADQMLRPSIEDVTDTEKLKEVGIKNPFPHAYYINKSKFPGADGTEMPANFVNFTISIAPVNSDIQNLQELLKELSFHSTESIPQGNDYHNKQNPLGWVGGFADYTTRTMYITEIQSDVMQRTKYMVDPELQKTQIKEKIQKNQNELERLTKLERSKPPKQILQEQINRINNEQLRLQPNSSQHNKNVQLLNRLQQQLTLAPEVPNQRTLQNKIRKITEILSDLNSQLLNVDKTDELYRKKKKNPAKYHAQKGLIERTFRDWIPIFFNAAIREAKKRNFLHLKLISAKQLMNSWAGNGRQEKETLFKRIYDNTAQLHNGKPVNEQSKEWWDIPLENARYANWAERFIGNASRKPHPLWAGFKKCS